MSDVALWKTLLDLCLLLSLAFLGFRIIKSEGPGARLPKLLELERSLKSIISEAQQAGNMLNKELRNRQRDLEKVLFDLETVESRMNRAVTSAEDRKGALEIEIGKAREMIHEVSNSMVTGRANTMRSAEQTGNERSGPELIRDEVIELRNRVEPIDLAPEPPSFVAKGRAEGEEARESLVSAKATRTNIYGEPIAEVKVPEKVNMTRTKNKSLANRIEVTEQNPYSRQEVLKSRLEDVYYAAEVMLRAGRDVESVATRTKLPLDEVRMLEQMVSREKVLQQAVETPPVVDPRLGVLAKAGRSGESAR